MYSAEKESYDFQNPEEGKTPKKATAWRGLDSNQRRRRQRIYSPPPLTTRAPLHNERQNLFICLYVFCQGF